MKKLKLSECNVLESSNTIFFDVDDTLIRWDTYNRPNASGPYNSPNPCLVNIITVEDPHMKGHMMTFRPHLAHCHILIRNYHQGRTVIVWSAAGYKWAETIVKALGLEQYVSLILEKPSVICDDTPMENWHPKTIFLKHDTEGEIYDE